MSLVQSVVRSLVFSVLTSMLIISGAMASESARPTNFLLIVTDDQRWDEFGLVQREQGEKARFPFLKTPRLDALAAQGMRFRNAFVTTSLCSPSRSAMLTGQYNHTNGIINNTTPFSPRPTWATALQSAGYTTAYIGKWHHGENQWERPGFDYFATYAGQGLYNNHIFKINSEAITKTRGYIDARSTDFAVEFLEEIEDKPFAMMVGFKAVHQPFTPMEEHADDYDETGLRPTPNWNSAPPWSRLDDRLTRRHPAPLSPWRQRLQAVNGIDKNVGRLLDALDRLDLADNTLVIFTSDNGFYFGEHALGDKRSAYEESIRVPMIARLPGVIEAGSISDDLVLNIDLAPTFLDLANQSATANMHGHSLRPLFTQTPTPWREAFLYEYWQENTFWNRPGKARTPSILAVRTANQKLITYPDFEKWTELFDLETDPYETRNLVGYNRAMKTHIEMCNLLQELLIETDYVDPSLPGKWLIGRTESYFTAQRHAQTPVARRLPPLLHPNC